MAKSSTKSRSGSKPRRARKAQTPKARPEVNAREVFRGFKTGNYQAYVKKNHIRLNQTGVNLVLDGNQTQAIDSIDALNAAFAQSSGRWEADERYGRQHYNRYGFMHRDGLTRLDDEALGMLMSQAGEELAQRASMAGTDATGRKIDPAVASRIIEVITAWLPKRPAAIKANKRAQAYAIAEADTKGEAPTLTLKTEAA